MILKPLGVALALLAGSVGTAWADATSFRVLLGGRDLGGLTLDATGSGEGRGLSLSAAFDNTPLGVADGTFEATSRPVRTEAVVARQYLGRSASTRRSRTISVLTEGGRALETVVEPLDERTDLSDVERVPIGVLDPVEALAGLVEAGGCPEPFRIYDGRRVIEVSIATSEASGGVLTCQGAYRVVSGPGHLSPLKISTLGLSLRYDTSGAGGAVLSEIDLTTRVFDLRLVR